MLRKIIRASMLLFSLWASCVQAGAPIPQPNVPSADCVATYIGQIICPPPGGTVIMDSTGRVICGAGQCRMSNYQWVCSSRSGGAATMNALGQILCYGGCVAASEANCQQLQ